MEATALPPAHAGGTRHENNKRGNRMGDGDSQTDRPSTRAARALIAVLLLCAARPAAAIDGVSLTLGADNSSHAKVDLVRLGAQWQWNKRWLEGDGWHLGGYWDLQAGYWDNRSPNKTSSGIGELAITPVFRVQENTVSSLSPFAEIGIGAHLLSKTSVAPQREFSTAFQFGSHAGVGLRFGQGGAYELGYRYQHLSNAGIKKPNNGINFHLLRLGYRFR